MEIIVGVFVSIGVALIKKYFGTESWQTYFIGLATAIGASLVYWILKDSIFWDSLLKVLSGAGIIYTYIFSALKK